MVTPLEVWVDGGSEGWKWLDDGEPGVIFECLDSIL